MAKTNKIVKPQLNLDNFCEWLADHNICVRRNVINHRLEITGMDDRFDVETIDASVHIILHDELKQEYSCTSSLVADLLGVIGGVMRFNPVTELLTASPPWDGKDHIEETYQILRLPDDDVLSRILLRKWYVQCIVIKDNDEQQPFGADGMLTILGPQGVGKTRFIEKLGMRPDLVRLGAYIDFRDKDTLIRSTSSWITELGELESSLRSDQERMKAFITSATDSYRLPYARSDSNLLRRTSFAATASSDRLLVDPTGSRRFWTIPVETIDLEALDKLDPVQLWQQVQNDVDTYGRQSFRLTPIEQRLLAERNSHHERPLKAQPEIEDILTDAEDNPKLYEWENMTVSDFKSYYTSLSRYSVEQIGKALDKLGIHAERKSIDGKQVRARKLPCRDWSKQKDRI